jgi:hypothetical protein
MVAMASILLESKALRRDRYHRREESEVRIATMATHRENF